MTFELDDDERLAFDAWNKKHLREHHHGIEPYGGAIGGRISFSITGTSIGRILSVECAACLDKPKDVYYHCLTDFSDW